MPPVAAEGPASVFAHGVASSDPQDHCVVIWTRVSGAPTDGADVEWTMSYDPDLRDVVRRLSRTTSGRILGCRNRALKPGRVHYNGRLGKIDMREGPERPSVGQPAEQEAADAVGILIEVEIVDRLEQLVCGDETVAVGVEPPDDLACVGLG